MAGSVAALGLIAVVAVSGARADPPYVPPVPLTPADGVTLSTDRPLFSVMFDATGIFPDRFPDAQVSTTPDRNSYGGFVNFFASCRPTPMAPATTYGQAVRHTCQLELGLPPGTYYWDFVYQHGELTADALPTFVGYRERRIGPFRFTISLALPAPTPVPPQTKPILAAKQKCFVPSVIGRAVPYARRTLRTRNCVLGLVIHAKTKGAKIGIILRQRPEAGTLRPNGTSVTVWVARHR